MHCSLFILFALIHGNYGQIVHEEVTIFRRVLLTKNSVKVALNNDAVVCYSHSTAFENNYLRQRNKMTALIEATEGYRVYLRFRASWFELSARTMWKQEWESLNVDCATYPARMEIYDGPSELYPLMHTFCGTDYPNPSEMFSSGQFLTIVALLPGPQDNGDQSSADFQISVNNWRPAENCTRDDMRCDDYSCIPKRLLCDTNNFPHCPDDTDTRADLREYCVKNPPIDLFGMGWFWRITIIYLIIVGSFASWTCCVRPGIFWYLIGCFRRWNLWPAICRYGCPFYITSCSQPVQPPDPTRIYKKSFEEEVIYEEVEEDEDRERLTSKVTHLKKMKRGTGRRRDSGWSSMTGNTFRTGNDMSKMGAPLNPPAYSEIETHSPGQQGRICLEIEEVDNVQKDGPSAKTQTVTKRKMDPIPPNVCLFEEFNMHIRENRF